MKSKFNYFKGFVPPLGVEHFAHFPSGKKNFIRLLLCSLLLMPLLGFAQAESEPNNETTTADAISFGATGNGEINPAGDIDYWQLTTTENGKIKVDFTHSGIKFG